jgi:hypothetical protein
VKVGDRGLTACYHAGEKVLTTTVKGTVQPELSHCRCNAGTAPTPAHASTALCGSRCSILEMSGVRAGAHMEPPRYLGGNRDVCGVRGWGASSLALHHLPPVAFVWCNLVNRPTQSRG